MKQLSYRYPAACRFLMLPILICLLNAPAAIFAQQKNAIFAQSAGPATVDQRTNPTAILAKRTAPADEAAPLIGTGKSSHRTVWESNGATFPGVLLPFGMVQITPDGYHYTDTHIRGFSYLDHNSGWGSGGSFLVMPYTGSVNLPSAFLHAKEESHPWRYEVDLADFHIHSSFTATTHAGFARFVFPASGQSHILITDVTDIRILSDTLLTGQSHGHWFIARSSKPFLLQPAGPSDPQQADPNHAASNQADTTQSHPKDPTRTSGIRLDYTTTAGEIIDLQIGFSLTSSSAAASNLALEMPDNDFERLSRQNRQVWNDRLSRIEIKGNDTIHRKIFYTALYHASFMPRIISDAGETPRRYTPLYPWDTYRSEHPLIALLDPLAEGDMISSVLDVYDRTGWLPTGNMLGNHNVELILDAYNKGIRNFDPGKAAQAIRKSLLDAPYARRDMKSYNTLGYVPASIVNSVSQTLEFAYNDWAGAAFLKLAGEKTDSDSLLHRSYNYQHVFDAATGFMRAKTDSGSWTSGGYCEGTEWTYSWYVPHDVRGLANLMGGYPAFSQKLSECLEKGYYVHDNEPPLHYAYLFDFIGEPWKTQQWARFITESSYSADPGGLPGNDDLGALSSWYVFSAMGFYPVTPGRPAYELGSPLFDECILHLPNGKDFRIQAPDNSPKNKYIQYATLNGQPYKRPWISHAALLEGGTLVLHMGPAPNKKWGSAAQEAPASQTTGHPDLKVSPPLLSARTTTAGQAVEASCQITNTGTAAGSQRVEIFVDGHPYSTTNVLVNAHHTQRLTMPILLYTAGNHKITLEHTSTHKITPEYAGNHKITIRKTAAPQKLFVKATSPVFVYRDLSAPLPALVDQADSFTVSAKVKNTGSSSARLPVTLYRDNQSFSTLPVFLQPGQEKEISFRLSGKSFSSPPAAEKNGAPLSSPGIGSLPPVTVSIGNLPPTTIRILDHHELPAPDTALLRRLGAMLVLNFDQGTSRQVTDLSGSGNHGTVYGNVKWVEGLFGKAIQTNAAENSYIGFPSNSGMDSLAHNSTLTMMAWIYPMDEENFSDILCKGDWETLQVKGSNTVINFCTGGWEGHEAFSAVPAGWNRHWHHIAGVAYPSYEELYIDGHLVAVKKMEPRDPNGETGTTDYSGSPWNIGRNESDHTRIFKGYIDDVMIFRTALTPEEINRLMLHVP